MGSIQIRHSEPLASNPASSPAWRTFWQHILSPAAERVYRALRHRDGETLDSYYFAARLGLTERQLGRALLELQRLGFIDIPKHPKDIA